MNLMFSCSRVSLTMRDASEFKYRNAMSVVKREVKLSKLDITELRRAITRALLFETSGQDTGSKVSRRTESMAATLKDLSANVTVPRRTAELRVTELEDTVTPEEVVAAVAEAGDCRVNEVNVGVIRSAPWRHGSVWLPADSSQESQRKRGRPTRR